MPFYWSTSSSSRSAPGQSLALCFSKFCSVNEMGNIEQMHNSRGEPNAVKEVRSDAHFANVNETGNKVQN